MAINIKELQKMSLLASNDEVPRRWWRKSTGDPLLRDLFPTGTRAEAMK